jgi:hypothetical protein
MRNPDIPAIAGQMLKIYDRIEQINAERRDDEDIVSISAGDCAALAIASSGIEQVGDQISGLRYAAHSIGETLMAVGGIKLMADVIDAVEEQRDETAGEWVSIRWDGVSLNDQFWSR